MQGAQGDGCAGLRAGAHDKDGIGAAAVRIGYLAVDLVGRIGL